MNWFNKSLGHIKTAAVDAAPNAQTGKYLTLFDAQRYVMDSYSVKIAHSKTGTDISVSLMVSHNFLGTIGYDAYWVFPLSEVKKSSTLYNTIDSRIKSLMDECLKEKYPTSMFWPMVKSKIEDLAIDNQVSTNIPSINYSRHLKIEPDWRKNIYGNRYPAYREKSYKEHYDFNKSLWPT